MASRLYVELATTSKHNPRPGQDFRRSRSLIPLERGDAGILIVQELFGFVKENMFGTHSGQEREQRSGIEVKFRLAANRAES